MGLLRDAITRARGSNPFDFRNRELLDALQREPAAPILSPIAPSLPPRIPFFPQVPLPAPVLPPSIPDPTPLERLPIITPRDEQIFVPPRTIVDRELPREVLPPVLPPFVPPPQPPVAPPVAPPVIPPQPPSIGGIGGINQDPRPLERPIIPPRRDDFMSIERIGDGGTPISNDGTLGDLPSGALRTGRLVNSDDLRERKRRELVERGIKLKPRQDIGPPPTDPIVEPVPTPDSIITDPVPPAPTTPTAVATDVGADPVTTIPQDVRGQVDPVLAQQDTRELQTGPLLRALYFGTAGQPGFINQLQQATANLIGSDVPLQGTAGLSDLEQMAQQRALADLGVAEPFVGESADLIRGTTRQFDPNMTQQFFNPFENQVVQQTIQDVLEAGEKRDVAQRARDIQTGGLSAFGSRARLSAADRQEALGRGLAEALGGIRQAGFGQAQRDALTTFAQQRQAEQQAARDIGQVGSSLADLRARERAGLVGFGQTGRDIEETALSRLFQQQVDAQGRPLQALQVAGGLLPQFQAGSTQIDSQYRLPSDPSALGLGAAFGAYTSLKPPGTQTG